MTTKPISIKNTGGKSGGCAWKAVELTSGDLPFVSDSRLRGERSILTGRQKSAEGRSSVDSLGNQEGAKARTVPPKGLMGAASKRCDSRTTSGRRTS